VFFVSYFSSVICPIFLKRKVNQHGLLSLPAKECVLARVLVSTTMLSANVIVGKRAFLFINFSYY
jgi:hypothetical protein